MCTILGSEKYISFLNCDIIQLVRLRLIGQVPKKPVTLTELAMRTVKANGAVQDAKLNVSKYLKVTGELVEFVLDTAM